MKTITSTFPKLKIGSSKLLLALLTLLISSVLIPFSPIIVAQEGETAVLTVVAPALNVRTGPGLTFSAIAYLLQDEQVIVLDYDAVNDWWQVQLSDGGSGWISGGPEYVAVVGDSFPSSVLPTASGPLADPVTDAETSPAVGSLPATESIVFQTASGGPIYAINPDGSNLRYLTTGLDPMLSPTGQQVAFTRWEASQGGALGQVWVINIDGSNAHIILDNIHQPRSPVWSPDGTQITVSMQHGGRPQAVETCGNQSPGRNAEDVSIERDGYKVVRFCYTLPPDPHWGLRVVDLASGLFEDLPHNTYSLSPAWDPINAWHVVFDGDRGLVNLDINQGSTWPLNSDVNDRSPVFSPDGTKIATSYRQHDHWEVHVMNADGSGRMRLTETPWSVIVQQDLANTGQPLQVWNNAAPVWSPDGAQIAFLSDRNGAWEIWVMNVDGSEQRPLFPAELLNGLDLQYNGMNERVLSWR